MSIASKYVKTLICDQCEKQLDDVKVWWRLVVNSNISSDKDFCSDTCATLYRNARYHPIKYDPIEIDMMNRGD